MHRRIRYFQVTQYIMQFTLVSIEVFILFFQSVYSSIHANCISARASV